MFKKIIVLFLVLLMTLPTMVFAQSLDLSQMSDTERLELLDKILDTVSKDELNNALQKLLPAYSDDELIALKNLLESEIESRNLSAPLQTLQNGSSGDDVLKLQQRLISLGYLSGSADGAFGNKTAEAVKLFQQEVGLNATGIADPDTQAILFTDNAPAAKVYLELDFKALSRNPDNYIGKNYTFSGKVLQVMESSSSSGTQVDLRIATKGSYDDVVYVTYTRKDGESRILEDDRVTVRGSSLGLYTYTSTMGKEISLPLFLGESVTLQ